MLRILSRLACAALFLAAPAAGQAPAATGDDPFQGASALERPALVQAVLARNPSLEAARWAFRAAAARVPQVRALADPMAGYGIAPLSVGSADVPFGQQLDLRQELPFPGKRRTRAAQAEAEAEGSLEDYHTAVLELATRASLLYDDYYLIHRAKAINDEHLRLLGEFKEVATGRYAAGLIPQQDPLRAEVEVAQLLAREVELEAERKVLLATINALLHRRPDLPLPPPVTRLGAPEPVAADVLELQQAALAARPELAASQAEIRAREAELGLAGLERRPDFELMASYNSMWMDPEHRLMAGVAINLPIRRGRLDAMRTEAEARLQQAESERQRMELEVRSQVQAAWARLGELRHHVEIYESRLLPAARDQVQAARADFQTGGGSLLSLIDAARNLRAVELGYEESLTGLSRRRTDLERALGRLPGEVEPPPGPESTEELRTTTPATAGGGLR